MATNPLYHTNDSPNNSTQPTKSVNRQGVYVPRTHNAFDMSYFNYKTQKFGQYEPFFVMEAVPRDLIPLHSSHQVRTLPLATPFLAELTLNKDYFMVPNNAIQPNTWDYIYDHPAQGDDVPEDAQNIMDFSWIKPLLEYLVDPHGNNISSKQLLWILLTLEPILSNGSLLAQLGFRTGVTFTLDGVDNCSFDDVFDAYLGNGDNCKITFDLTTDSISMDVDSDKVGLYTALSLLRSYGSQVGRLSVTLTDHSVSTGIKSEYWKVRLDRVCAYQLACAQFYVNPKVDFIYNAQLYRDNFFTLISDLISSYDVVSISSFSYNGILVPYDYFSKYYYDLLLDAVVSISSDNFVKFFDVINYLFGFRESLRFGDYFTDSRTRPLAIGDDNYQVNQTTNQIDVLDFTRNIVFQRFRNAVVKLGNNMGDYLRGIMGSEPAPDYHLPKFISHSDFKIGGNEVANTTSTGLGELVTNLNTNDDRFAFEVSVDMPCILIGISSFSVPRLYSQSRDKFWFHQDRYDFFNPMLQYFGDQAIVGDEMGDIYPNNTFGYQSRYGEYKQRSSIATGGFIQKLPAWSFVADSPFKPVVEHILYHHQSESFIRAHDYEFNRFFNAMPGVSLCTGFHFIVVYNNKCMSNRPMEVNPSTL